MRSGTAAEQRARLTAWFKDQLPKDWFVGPVDVIFDNDEILVIGQLPDPDQAGEEEAEAECIDRFREDTREQRVLIAQQAEQQFRRKVSWGAACGSTTSSTRSSTLASLAAGVKPWPGACAWSGVTKTSGSPVCGPRSNTSNRSGPRVPKPIASGDGLSAIMVTACNRRPAVARD
jgi:hypothetical protein